MLAIGIRYLCGWAMAKEYTSNHQTAEWPPHPDRVFMAMAAAHLETDSLGEERAALEWLEGQGPPTMYASKHQDRRTVTSYVPVPDTQIARKGTLERRIERYRALKTLDKAKDAGLALLPEFRSRQPRTFPTAIPDDPAICLCWEEDEPSAGVRAALAELCAKVTYLGHSASLVQMWVADRLPEGKDINWVPDKRGIGKRLRISGPGRLAYLESQFNLAAIEEHTRLSAEIEAAKGKQKKALTTRLEERFGDSPPRSMRPTPSLWRAYARVKKEEVGTDISQSVFDYNLLVLRRVGGRQFGLESTLQMTAALRDTVMSKCPVQPPPEWISGHELDGCRSEQSHLAFVPLAYVGDQHSDGHLLGAAIVMPRRIESSEMRLLSPVVGYDENGDPVTTTLTFGTLGKWSLQLDDRDTVPKTLQEFTWTASGSGTPGARRWATVTPIVFDAHPKDRWSKNDSPRVRAERQASYWRQVEDMIAAAVERIDLPRPVEVVAQSTSHLVGVPHIRRFPQMQRKGGGNLHHTHAVITFEKPVLGPVLVGAGRYRGYGLCRPLREEGRP